MKCQLSIFNGRVQCEKTVARTLSWRCSALDATSSKPIPGATPQCGSVRFPFSQWKTHQGVGKGAKYVLFASTCTDNKTQWKVTLGCVSWSDSELCRENSFSEAYLLTYTDLYIQPLLFRRDLKANAMFEARCAPLWACSSLGPACRSCPQALLVEAEVTVTVLSLGLVLS